MTGDRSASLHLCISALEQAAELLRTMKRSRLQASIVTYGAVISAGASDGPGPIACHSSHADSFKPRRVSSQTEWLLQRGRHTGLLENVAPHGAPKILHACIHVSHNHISIHIYITVELYTYIMIATIAV